VIIVGLLSAYWRSPAPRSTCAQVGLGLVTQVRVGMVSVGMVLVGIVRVGMVTCTRECSGTQKIRCKSLYANDRKAKAQESKISTSR